MSFWEFTLSYIVSVLALIISIVSIYINKQQHKENLDLNERLAKIQTIQSDQQIYFQEQQNRISQIPYFCLDVTKPIYTTTDGQLILPITLINVGIQSATSIHLKPINDKTGLDCFADTLYDMGVKHYVHEYLDKYFALPQSSICFSFLCDEHKNKLKLSFKIEFSDLIGRIYEQTFSVLYCGKEKIYAQNHFSSIPRCLDKRDGTCGVD